MSFTSPSHSLQTIPWAIAEGRRQSGDVQKEASSRSVPDTEHTNHLCIQVIGELEYLFGGKAHKALRSLEFYLALPNVPSDWIVVR